MKYIVMHNKTNKIIGVFFSYQAAYDTLMNNKDRAGVHIRCYELKTEFGKLYL